MDGPEIPWARVAAFVRQHAHDVRDSLNSLDLEAALLDETASEGEVKATMARFRKQLRSLALQLRSLSAHFQEPQPVAAPIPARVLLQIWREKHAALPDAPEVQWLDKLGDEHVKVDVEMLATVFRELLTNAATFSKGDLLTVTARAKDGDVIFELREPKKEVLDTSDWGQPFSSTHRGGYGLGLWTARRMMEANGATLVQHQTSEDRTLTTQIVLAVC